MVMLSEDIGQETPSLHSFLVLLLPVPSRKELMHSSGASSFAAVFQGDTSRSPGLEGIEVYNYSPTEPYIFADFKT